MAKVSCPLLRSGIRARKHMGDEDGGRRGDRLSLLWRTGGYQSARTGQLPCASSVGYEGRANHDE